VHPVTTRSDDWDAPWTQLVRRRATRIGVRGVLYEKKKTG
jgi:hypothetical protein